eukprot:TRINITY_DN1762_c0_g1_i2.p1 TRINITY_DN1762_c0_g1~~TRINITY_DN1762_c0_g1_i2.p1  ORF type:complete len:132 (+),score=18.32 TRINITY_DN1762_c0_g1_i2:293-688(+)
MTVKWRSNYWQITSSFEEFDLSMKVDNGAFFRDLESVSQRISSSSNDVTIVSMKDEVDVIGDMKMISFSSSPKRKAERNKHISTRYNWNTTNQRLIQVQEATHPEKSCFVLDKPATTFECFYPICEGELFS